MVPFVSMTSLLKPQHGLKKTSSLITSRVSPSQTNSRFLRLKVKCFKTIMNLRIHSSVVTLLSLTQVAWWFSSNQPSLKLSIKTRREDRPLWLVLNHLSLQLQCTLTSLFLLQLALKVSFLFMTTCKKVTQRCSSSNSSQMQRSQNSLQLLKKMVKGKKEMSLVLEKTKRKKLEKFSRVSNSHHKEMSYQWRRQMVLLRLLTLRLANTRTSSKLLKSLIQRVHTSSR